MARVVIAAAVIELAVEGVVQNDGTVLADLIESMRPSVGKLRSQGAPASNAENGLQGVVVGRAGGVELQDVAEIGEGVVLIDVGHDIEPSSRAAHVAYLPEAHVPEALFDLQIVIVKIGCAEVWADGIGAQTFGVGWSRAVRVAASLDSGEDCARRVDLAGVRRALRAYESGNLNRIPLVRCLAAEVRLPGRDRRGTEGVALNPLRGRDGRAEVQKRIHVDLIVEKSEASAHHQIAFGAHPIGKPDARREVLPVRGVDPVCVHTLHHKSLSRNEVGDVLARAVERPEVFVTQAQIEVELAVDLPTVRQEKVERVHGDVAFRIPHGDRRGEDVAGEKIGQSLGRRELIATLQSRARRRRRSRATPARSAPRPLGAVKDEFAGPATMIELVHSRSADLPSVAQLMGSPDLRNDVREVPGEVAAALGRR